MAENGRSGNDGGGKRKQPPTDGPESKCMCISRIPEFKKSRANAKLSPSDRVFADVIARAERGELESVKNSYPGIYTRYKKTLESLVRYTTDDLEDCCGIWMTGPPGSGKGLAVASSFKSVYCKGMNKWFDGYRNEECIHLADMDKKHKYMGHYLKIWADCYSFRGEIKRGTIVLRPKYVVVTSKYGMEDIFDGMTLTSLQTRFAIITFDPVGGVRIKERPMFPQSDRYLKALENLLRRERGGPELVPEAGPSGTVAKSSGDEADTSDFKPQRKRSVEEC